MPSERSLTWMSLSRLHAEGGAVDDLAVNEDVTVHNHLARLRRGACEACAQHECVETHLEELDQVLTGQAVLTTGFLEGDGELLLADAVLGAKTLLLTQTHRVVAVALTLGAAMLAGAVGALLEVASCLRGQGNPERAGKTGL